MIIVNFDFILFEIIICIIATFSAIQEGHYIRIGKEAESENEKHIINCEIIENEYYVCIKHEMTKEHYISFIAYVINDRCEIVKLYPEQNAEARFLIKGKGIIYVYCNKDGLIKKKI